MQMRSICLAVLAVFSLAVTGVTSLCDFRGASYQVNEIVYPVRTHPLVDYVHTPDDMTSYFDTEEMMNGPGYKGYLLNLTSQVWLPDMSSRPTWTHNLLVIVPDEINPSTSIASIYITGENNRDEPSKPKPISPDIIVASSLAIKTKSIVAILYQIPNQSIAFRDRETGEFGKYRGEDRLVAETWKMYVENPERSEQIVYIPMVKAVFSAMGAVTNFTRSRPDAFPVPAEQFVIAGASKRGAIAWLSAVADAALQPEERRIVGIVPIVFDILNLEESVGQMFRNLNGWPVALEPYYDVGLTEWLASTPKITKLACIIDPMRYPSFKDIPSTIAVSATGDEFFQPSDDWSWWPTFSSTGPYASQHYRVHVHNAEHAMVTGLETLMTSAGGFVTSLQRNATMPDFSWTIKETDSTLTFITTSKPSLVKLYRATSFKSSPVGRRDFRMIKGDTPAGPCVAPAVKVADVCVNPIMWINDVVEAEETLPGVWGATYTPETPEEGRYVGFFFEVHFPPVVPGAESLLFTTQISIHPREYPYPSCIESGDCKGDLL